jgi:hypothetical protein
MIFALGGALRGTFPRTWAEDSSGALGGAADIKSEGLDSLLFLFMEMIRYSAQISMRKVCTEDWS